MASPRRLLARLRETMAHGTVPLAELAELIAAELASEVCSIYAGRPAKSSSWLRPRVSTRRRSATQGFGWARALSALCAATAQVMNLPDAQNHPSFAYRPETGEEPFASMLAVPVRRAGRTLGVVAVQSRQPRSYSEEEVDELETVAMLLAEVLATARRGGRGRGRGRRDRPEGIPRRIAGPWHCHRPGSAARRPRRPDAVACRRSRRRIGAAARGVAAHAAGPGRAVLRCPGRSGRDARLARCWKPTG